MQEQSGDQQTSMVPLRVNWRSADDVPVHVGNQFMLQFTQEGYVLSFGQVMPPAVIGASAEEIRDIGEVSVNVLGRIALTPERTRALLLLLRRQMAIFSPDLSQEVPAEEQTG